MASKRPYKNITFEQLYNDFANTIKGFDLLPPTEKIRIARKIGKDYIEQKSI